MHLKGKKILKAAITAVGGYTPKTILSNHKLETMVDIAHSMSNSVLSIPKESNLHPAQLSKRASATSSSAASATARGRAVQRVRSKSATGSRSGSSSSEAFD